jgi:hypothetical protein
MCVILATQDMEAGGSWSKITSLCKKVWDPMWKITKAKSKKNGGGMAQLLEYPVSTAKKTIEKKKGKKTNHIICFTTVFFFLSGTEVWTQGFVLAVQVLYCLSHTSSSFCPGCFRGGVLWITWSDWFHTLILPISYHWRHELLVSGLLVSLREWTTSVWQGKTQWCCFQVAGLGPGSTLS